MRFAVVFLFAILGYVAARPQFVVPSEPAFRIVPTLVKEDVRDDAGQYSSFYRSADGGSQSSYGVLRPNPDGRGHFLAITGSYSYTSPDGTPVYVSYEADDKGFRIINGPVPEAPVVVA